MNAHALFPFHATAWPDQFSDSVAGGLRNAWRDLWIRMPGDKAWKKAAYQRIAQDKIETAAPARFTLASPDTAPAIMAESLKNALVLIEKASQQRIGRSDRRTDILPDD